MNPSKHPIRAYLDLWCVLSLLLGASIFVIANVAGFAGAIPAYVGWMFLLTLVTRPLRSGACGSLG
jgi:hypothetical protein